MLRIVGVNRHPDPNREFVLLQNQGGLRVNLRGHVVMAEVCVEQGMALDCFHIFNEQEAIPPGAFVVLQTGPGDPKWTRTKDSSLAYYCYLNQPESVWDRRPGPLHILAINHTFANRPQPLVVS